METVLSRVFFVFKCWEIQNLQLKRVPYNKLLTNSSRTGEYGSRSFLYILGNPGLQRGWEGKGETGSGEKRRGEGKGKGKPWEASLYRSFLDRRVNTISEV